MNHEDPSQFEGLSPSDQAKLTELLDAYIRGLEQGCPPDESLDYLQDAAAGFCPVAASYDCAAADLPSSSKQIGDFRIVREVGRGGMGVVYEAWQISLDRRVALKVLPFAALLDSKQIARFRNEARAAAQLQHPNIVPVFAVGVDRGAHYFAMQFIDGQPLDRAIDGLRQAGECRNHPQRPADDTATALATAYSKGSPAYFRAVAKLGLQAAEALHAAHETGIVHRDIKPSNLLLDADAKLWIADFGLARCRWETNLTGPGDVVGTLRYMSPEQMHGQGQVVDHRTDIYSLGVTLYELLSLRHAIRGADAATISRELERGEPYPLRLWDQKIPVDLETIVHKAIAKDPSDRYATAQELASDLGRFLAGQPTQARRPTPLDRAGKWTRRHKRVVATAASALTLAAVGLLVATLLLARERQHTQRALAEASANYRQYRAQLALSTHHLGVLQNQSGDRRQAQESFLKARQLQLEMLQESPDDMPSLRALAATLNNLTFLNDSSDPGQAATRHQEAVRIHERLVAAAPENDAYQRDLAQAYGNFGSFQARQRQSAPALAAFERAIAILREQSVRRSDGTIFGSGVGDRRQQPGNGSRQRSGVFRGRAIVP